MLPDSFRLQQLIEARSANGWQVRLKLLQREAPEPWSRFLILPSPGYIETEAGPVALREVEAILIGTIEYRYTGKLIPDKRYDHTKDIITLLDSLQVPFLLQDDHIRVWFSDLL